MSGKKRTIIELRATPVPSDSEKIVRVTAVCGANQIEIEQPNGDKCLCDIPTKFQKKIWIKRGDYVIAEMYSNAKVEKKVKAEVAHVLLVDHVKQLKKDKLWPSEFATKEDSRKAMDLPPSDSEEEDEEDDQSTASDDQ